MCSLFIKINDLLSFKSDYERTVAQGEIATMVYYHFKDLMAV